MIIKYKEFEPSIDKTCFLADNCRVIGRVSLGKNVNIWYGAILRGDVNYIEVGENTNIQDNCVVHVDSKFPTIIGKNVTIGHGAIVHGCTISDNVLIGMGSIILDGAYIEENVIIGAGALVPPGKRIPKNSLVVGSPGKVVRQLSDEEIEKLQISANNYVNLSKEYLSK